MYFVTKMKGKVQHLICLQTIAVLKKYNLRCHYVMMHSETCDVITEKMREEKVLQLKTAFAKQTNFFSNID